MFDGLIVLLGIITVAIFLYSLYQEHGYKD